MLGQERLQAAGVAAFRRVGQQGRVPEIGIAAMQLVGALAVPGTT